jgi:hypothetical protein
MFTEAQIKLMVVISFIAAGLALISTILAFVFRSKTTSNQFKEKGWFLYGFIIKRLIIGFMIFDNEGEPHSVEFDWKKGLAKFLIGWFHSHPRTAPLRPSTEDQRTMRSWVRALDKPLICGIIYTQRTKKDSMWRSCYMFKRWPDGSVGYRPVSKSKLFKNLYIGILDSWML